jgi:hypothetical protein
MKTRIEKIMTPILMELDKTSKENRKAVRA